MLMNIDFAADSGRLSVSFCVHVSRHNYRHTLLKMESCNSLSISYGGAIRNGKKIVRVSFFLFNKRNSPGFALLYEGIAATT